MEPEIRRGRKPEIRRGRMQKKKIIIKGFAENKYEMRNKINKKLKMNKKKEYSDYQSNDQLLTVRSYCSQHQGWCS